MMRFLTLFVFVILCSTFSAVSAQDKGEPVDPKAKKPVDPKAKKPVDPKAKPIEVKSKLFDTKGKALDLKGKALQQKFEDLLPGMAAEDIESRWGPQQEWQAICYHAGVAGNEEQRLEACKLMVAKLDPKTPDPTRLWLLKQLEFLGRGESVDSVAALVKEKDALIHDSAVRCLANNPAPEATAKLIAALPGAAGKARIGLINALGYRADKSAVKALELALNEIEVRIGEHDSPAEHAAKALGKIASPEATEVLASWLQKNVLGPQRFWLADAYLLCADRRLREGKTAEAKAIYSKLAESKLESRPIQLAAFRGILNVAGDAAGPLILEAINGTDADRKNIATIQIEMPARRLSNTLRRTSRSCRRRARPSCRGYWPHALASRRKRKRLENERQSRIATVKKGTAQGMA